MFDAKLVDSQEFNDTFFKTNDHNIKLNGYAINESRRLQIFVPRFYKGLDHEDALIYEKSVYDKQFKQPLLLKFSKWDTVCQIQYADAEHYLFLYR